MTESATPRGRPRDPRVDRTVRQAVRDALAETGYAGLTVDAIAARAGVGKAAIYRRFGSKAELAFAAAVHDIDVTAPPDTGSLVGDLYALARIVQARAANPVAREVIPALVAELGRNPALAEQFRGRFLDIERADFTEICARAVRRGELPGPVRPDIAHLMLAGPHFAALYAFHVPVDDALLLDFARAAASALKTLAVSP
ncbi:TetR/AcrR family transcriptional regulator [Streptodolium elevatio]|uniref:TetR/AcrR family transcriptional regulator n=1 Tax=Streptodolium elevatio TaxID=3157996 RepID=A0ABV3DC56_9ACTN